MSEIPLRCQVARADILDRLDTVDGTAVLVATPLGHRVVRLSAIGSAVLDVLDDVGSPIGLDQLADALVERLGPPEGMDALAAVWLAVGALAYEHVVEAES